MPASDSQLAAPTPRAWILHGAVQTQCVWGLSATERLQRSLRRAGAHPIDVLDPVSPAPSLSGGRCVVFRGDHFYDERLVEGLVHGEERLLVEPESGEALAALVESARLEDALRALRPGESSGPRLRLKDVKVVGPLDIAPAYNPVLRKFDPPLLCRVGSEPLREVEDRIFASSFKGLTDFVTKWIWPRPARAVTRWLARRGVRPNTVTWLSYVLALLVIGLFGKGLFGLGLLAAWLMTFLDTVDGKLARVTLTSSRLGHVLDKALDLVHPPFWWIAWAYGLAPNLAGYEVATGIVVGGYLFGRLLEGLFMLAFGMEIFLWRPFDGFFRTIIARRNPNLVLLSLGVLFGRPELGYLAVAAWTLACNAIHIERLVHAFVQRSRGIAIRPWYEEREAAAVGAAASPERMARG